MNSRPFALVLAFWLTLLLATSAPAQSDRRSVSGKAATPAAQVKIDVQMILTSDGSGTDTLAVAYGRAVPDPEIQADFMHLAGLLHIAPPQVKISRKAGIPAGEAKVSGLTNWSTGEVALDPLVDTFKRFGFFRLLCLFMGKFPLRSVDSFTRPPLRVEVTQSGENVVSYQIWVDQSAGVPKSLPTIHGSSGLGWKIIVGLLAVALVAAGSVFLIIQVVLGQRKRTGRR